jgi:hypothetical protein
MSNNKSTTPYNAPPSGMELGQNVVRSDDPNVFFALPHSEPSAPPGSVVDLAPPSPLSPYSPYSPYSPQSG